MNDLIEKLKQNEKPFGLNTKEEQECFERVGTKYCDYFEYGGCWREKTDGSFMKSLTYRISPTYQPEPEVERCEVGEFTENGKGVLMYFRGTDQKYLTEALNDPDFMWFEYENKYATNECRQLQTGSAEWPKYVVFRNRGRVEGE